MGCGEAQHGIGGVGGVEPAHPLDGAQLLLARSHGQTELPGVQQVPADQLTGPHGLHLLRVVAAAVVALVGLQRALEGQGSLLVLPLSKEYLSEQSFSVSDVDVVRLLTLQSYFNGL